MAYPYFTRPNLHDRQVVQYSGTTLNLSGDTNINQTGNFRINKGAFPGLVATSLDSDGTVVWGPISGISWSISACTSPLYVNNLVSCPLSAGTIQVDAGALTLNSELQFLISLSAGTNNDNLLVVDNNGYVKTIPYVNGSNMWYVPFGYTLTVPDNYQSFIYGDLYVLGTIDLQTNAQLVVLNGNIILSGGSIIGSGTTQLVTLGDNYVTGGTFDNSTGTLTLNRQNGSVSITGITFTSTPFTGGTGSCITDLYVTNIHGCSPVNIQPLSADDVYMVMGGGKVGIGNQNPQSKLHIKGSGDTKYTYSLKIDDNNDNPLLQVTDSGNIYSVGKTHIFSSTILPNTSIDNFESNSRGIRVYYDFTGDTANLIVNFNVSGRTTNGVGSSSNGVNANNRVFAMYNHGSKYLRNSPFAVNGDNFYQNKGVLFAGDNLDGIVINTSPNGNNGRLWFEQNANSPMVIAGGGTPSDLRLGIALNPDGTEIPTAQLQVGGTGTTGTFKYRDGNQQNGYVLTSDSDGNATWQSGSTITPSPYIFGSASLSIVTLSGDNSTLAQKSIVLGGNDNTIDANSTYSGVVSGQFNDISRTLGSFIGSGEYNSINGINANRYLKNLILNGYDNDIVDTGAGTFTTGYKTIINGARNTIQGTNIAEVGYETIVNGYNNTITDNITSYYNTILNGDTNTIIGSGQSVILNGSTNTINLSNASLVFGGQNNVANAGVDSVVFGYGNNVNNARGNFIRGSNNQIRQTTSSGVEKNHVIFGSFSMISGVCDTTIILGSNITGNTSNTVYVPDLIIKKSAAAPTTSGDTVGEVGSVTWDNSYLYVKTNTGWGRVSLDYVW